MSTLKLLEKINMLPPALQQQVFDFTDFLFKNQAMKKNQSIKPGLQFNWEGGLSDLKEKYTAVELQHQANTYRIEHALSD